MIVLDPAEVLRLASMVLLNLGFSVLLGTIAHGLVWRTGADSWSGAAAGRVVLAAWIGATGAVFGMAGLLWSESAVMGEVALADAATALPDVLRASHFGAVWLAGMLSLLVLSACVTWPRLRLQPAAKITAWVAMGGFALCRALASHAVDRGSWSPWVLVEAGHLIAIALWVGVVLVAGAFVLAPAGMSAPADQAPVHGYMTRISAVATWTLVAVLVTGGLNAWRTLARDAWPWQTPYGQTLLVKLALVALAVCLGGINRFQVMPRLANAREVTPALAQSMTIRLTAILRIEGVVLLTVLGVAASLSTSAPG